MQTINALPFKRLFINVIPCSPSWPHSATKRPCTQWGQGTSVPHVLVIISAFSFPASQRSFILTSLQSDLALRCFLNQATTVKKNQFSVLLITSVLFHYQSFFPHSYSVPKLLTLTHQGHDSWQPSSPPPAQLLGGPPTSPWFFCTCCSFRVSRQPPKPPLLYSINYCSIFKTQSKGHLLWWEVSKLLSKISCSPLGT